MQVRHRNYQVKPPEPELHADPVCVFVLFPHAPHHQSHDVTPDEFVDTTGTSFLGNTRAMCAVVHVQQSPIVVGRGPKGSNFAGGLVF